MDNKSAIASTASPPEPDALKAQVLRSPDKEAPDDFCPDTFLFTSQHNRDTIFAQAQLSSMPPEAGRVSHCKFGFDSDDACVRSPVRQCACAYACWQRERSRARQRVLQVAGNVCVCAHVRVRDS